MRAGGRPARVAELEAELREPPVPEEIAYLWRAFLRLHNRRRSNGFSAEAIGWQDMEAFCRLSGMHLTPWEVTVIEAIDGIYLTEQGRAARARAKEAESKKQDGGKGPRRG